MSAEKSPPDTPIRAICFIKKRPGMSDADFYHHWEHIHGPIIAPWVVKHGIERYTQIHTRPALRDQWSNLLVPPLPAPLPAIPHDGFAEMEFSSPEKMRNAFLDPYYAEVIAKDEANFLDKSQGEYGEGGGAMSTMGRVVQIVQDHKSVQAGTEEEKDAVMGAVGGPPADGVR